MHSRIMEDISGSLATSVTSATGEKTVNVKLQTYKSLSGGDMGEWSMGLKQYLSHCFTVVWQWIMTTPAITMADPHKQTNNISIVNFLWNFLFKNY